LCNLSRVQAQDRIFRDQYDPLDFKGVYQLHLEAYGDEDLAQKAQTEAAKRLVRVETEAARQKGK